MNRKFDLTEGYGKDDVISDLKSSGHYKNYKKVFSLLGNGHIEIEGIKDRDVDLIDKFMLDMNMYERLSYNDKVKCIEWMKYLTDYINESTDHHLSAINHKLHYDFTGYDKQIDYDYYRKIDIILVERIKKALNEWIDRLEDINNA